MANPEHVELLKSGVGAWNQWREDNPDKKPRLEGAKLLGANLQGANLQGANLVDANLQGANLEDANLRWANLERANLRQASLEGANLRRAILERANLERANLRWANLEGAKLLDANLEVAWLVNANLKGANLRRANLEGAKLVDANLKGANLEDANLEGAWLVNANLEGASLVETHLTGATFNHTKFGGTVLRNLRFTEEHKPFEDGSEYIRVPVLDGWMSWSRLRGIGEFPLFTVSYLALGFLVIYFNAIEYYNGIEWTPQMPPPLGLEELPVPQRPRLLLASATLLVFGSTLYRLLCPPRVRTFSETDWVEDGRQPRLMYLGESWRRRPLQWLTALFTVTGAGLAIWLLGERLVQAIRYVVSSAGG